MQAVTDVLFEREERKTLERMMLAAPVAFSDDVDTMRLLNGISQVGDTISRSRIVRARQALEALLSVLEAEATVVYWDRKVAMTEQERAMRDVIIEARKVMVVDVKAAQRVLADAVKIATFPVEVDN
jgi:hypothetical protein